MINELTAHCTLCIPWRLSYRNQSPCHRREEFWKWQLLFDVLDPTTTEAKNIITLMNL